MDFFVPKLKHIKSTNTIEVYPSFKFYSGGEDLLARGRSFYAVWDEENNVWSTSVYRASQLIDKEIRKRSEELREINPDVNVAPMFMDSYESTSMENFSRYLKLVEDTDIQLDSDLTFSNSVVGKKDYRSKRLPYPLEAGTIDAYEELVSTLYNPEERAKFEWAVGSVIAGDAKHIQKFVVFYGDAGTGKSTILNIIQKLFDGYYTTFEAKALSMSNNEFSTDVFRDNPLVAIQHDGDLSRIEDNTKLNSIVSHELMLLHEKYKPSYVARVNAMLFMGTNKPVKITDAKSGVIRRLIDVHPSGRLVPVNTYHTLMNRIDFELGAIAYHCLQVYREMGKNYYSNYKPFEMMMETNEFFNFVEDSYHVFVEEDGVTLKQAYAMYKEYCEEANLKYVLPRYIFREELKNYFDSFSLTRKEDGKQVRSYYSGFRKSKFAKFQAEEAEIHPCSLVLDCDVSLLDEMLADCKSQYGNAEEKPFSKWSNVETKLSDIDTSKLHYVRPPKNHIVVDFDLKDENGNKSADLNLEAASKWPATYAEFSKGHNGVHLHYIYDGDVDKLASLYSEGIEVKIFRGQSSLRRKLSKCNNIPVATISSGLPLKGEKVVNFDRVQSERGLRSLIARNLAKEIHPGTKPSIDFIHKILEDAYNSGMAYDVSDMRPAVMAFANNSTHHGEYCVEKVVEMKFQSDGEHETETKYEDNRLVFFDVEVYPNLFVVCWKYQGDGATVLHLVNPSRRDIEELMKKKLVGFNNRRYDNHILYAWYCGYTNEQLFQLSHRIVAGSRNAMFGEAYGLSYTDIYDFSSKKQSLKKFEIDLGIHHQEMDLPWDKPVPEELWPKVVEYCTNDVIATEATFNARHADYMARQILADLSGLSVNDTTQQHAARIIFGADPHPQDKFVYTDLSEMFPGYEFKNGKSSYRGEDPSEGGYVYAEPGMYGNIALLDIASMHPTSIECLNLFGPYTKNFSDIKAARVAIKHKDFDAARGMLHGILTKYLEDTSEADNLAYALKIVINIVYGLTSAKFDNKFRDPRNVDNIVAKRGALFMIDLKHAVQEKGYTVCHIKTDSIKIADADDEIIEFVKKFGENYGYTFEHEATYDRMCLVNDAVYIAKKQNGEWTATGAQFAQPYVFKTLFSKEAIEFGDMCETKSVTGTIYLDFNETCPDEHDYRFVGRVGLFTPVKAGSGGGSLYREKDGKYYAVGGTKGYRWLEAEQVKLSHMEDAIDLSYYQKLVTEAVNDISKYGDFEWFVSDDPYAPMPKKDHPPWYLPCGETEPMSCEACMNYCKTDKVEFPVCKLGYDVSHVIM